MIFDHSVNALEGLRDSALFSGKGAMKYNLINKLNRSNYHYNRESFPRLKSYSAAELELYFNELYITTVESNKSQLQLIQNSNGIKKNIKKLLIHDFYYRGWFDYAELIYTDKCADEEAKSKLINLFNQHNTKFMDIVNDEILLFSTRYFWRNINSVKTSLLINSKIQKIDLVAYYDTLKKIFTGKIKERFLLEFFMSTRTLRNTALVSKEVSDSLLIDADKYLTSTYSRKIIIRKLKFSKGRKFFDANFVNMEGEVFNTSKLRGKVFLLDIWGTGCSNCAIFHGIFKKNLWPYLKANNKFEYLSINVDRHKNDWIKSLNTGNYTSTDYINVFTGENIGLFNHPFSQYYNIQGTPFMLLIDENGHVIREIPTGLIDDNGIKLLGLINSALQNSNSK